MDKLSGLLWENVHSSNKFKTGPVLNVTDGLIVVYGENEMVNCVFETVNDM